MSRQARTAPAFPPTPEDETDMAQLHTGGGRATPTQGIAPVGLGQARKDSGSVDNIVGTPTSPSSSLALSRFEFEPGKGNEGTKVLMVEWDGSATHSTTSEPYDVSEDSNGHRAQQRRTDATEHKWVVTWEGKDSHNVLATSDNVASADGAERRAYFLLPPGATIPPLVSITRSRAGVCSNGSECEDGAMMLWTKPMPAIYPANLGLDAGLAGERGVLHTLWAKQRLAGLAAEIEAEMKANSESIGLQIALQEQDWVSDHFGVGEPSGLRASSPYLPSPASPTVQVAMPRSPIGGKLGEKLKGLRLATSPAELAAALQVKTATTSTDTTIATRSAGAVDRPGPAAFGTRIGLRTSIEPHMNVHSSLDAVIRDNQAVGSDVNLGGNVADAEDELFALPLSPRSPEMARSPFSLL